MAKAKPLNVLVELNRLARIGDDEPLRDYWRENAVALCEAFQGCPEPPTPASLWAAIEAIDTRKDERAVARATLGTLASLRERTRTSKDDATRAGALAIASDLVDACVWSGTTCELPLRHVTRLASEADDTLLGFYFDPDFCLAVDRRQLAAAFKALAMHKDLTCALDRRGLYLSWRGGVGQMRFSNRLRFHGSPSAVRAHYGTCAHDESMGDIFGVTLRGHVAVASDAWKAAA